MRFRLDPRAPAPERYVPPPPAPFAKPAAAPPPPPPPAPLAAPAADPAARRRLVILGAAVAALLLVGGAVAVYVALATGYPDDYTLRPSEYPEGMRTARLSSDDMEELGIASNPGDIDDDKLAGDFGTGDGEDPERGYALVLEDSGGARVAILSLRYADEDAARSATRDMRALCSFASGAVLRDGAFVVAVLPDNGASRAQVRATASAVQGQNGDLATVCGL